MLIALDAKTSQPPKRKPGAKVSAKAKPVEIDPGMVEVAEIPFGQIAKARLELTDELLSLAASEQGMAVGTEGGQMDVDDTAKPVKRPKTEHKGPKNDKASKKKGPGRFARKGQDDEQDVVTTDGPTDADSGAGAV